MILPPQEFLVMVQIRRNTHLMTGRAKLGSPMQRLQECPLVKIGIGLDELAVDPFQEPVVALSKRVMDRLLDYVIPIPFGAVDAGDRVTRSTSNPRLAGRMIHVIEVRIVEGATEERDHVVAACAPAR